MVRAIALEGESKTFPFAINVVHTLVLVQSSNDLNPARPSIPPPDLLDSTLLDRNRVPWFGAFRLCLPLGRAVA